MTVLDGRKNIMSTAISTMEVVELRCEDLNSADDNFVVFDVSDGREVSVPPFFERSSVPPFTIDGPMFRYKTMQTSRWERLGIAAEGAQQATRAEKKKKEKKKWCAH